jgi:solute carrier family 25 protein 44
MQIQQHNNVYTGLVDACRKIVAAEGISGLYKGFWVSAFQIVSGVCYVSVYEGVRHLLYDYNVKNSQFRALVAGGCASLVGQTFIVPFDVISQHLMVVGQKSGNAKQVLNPLNIDYIGRSRLEITKNITQEIYLRDGLRGFYRGYLASLSTYVPNSAMWWAFYHVYQDKLAKIVPNNTSHLVVQCVSATLGGFTTTIITNPLDVCRARLQVQRLDSFAKTMAILWREEQLKMFTKGLSARLTQSAVFSSAIILGYETIKRLSVKEDFLDKVRW